MLNACVKNYLEEPPKVEFAEGVTAARLNIPDESQPDIAGLSVDVLRFAAGAELPEHTHPERNHSLIVVRGIGWVSVKGEREDLSIGDVVDIRGSDVHSIGAEVGEIFEILSIGTPPADLYSPERMIYEDGIYKPREL